MDLVFNDGYFWVVGVLMNIRYFFLVFYIGLMFYSMYYFLLKKKDELKRKKIVSKNI